jgi:hypothetical protein
MQLNVYIPKDKEHLLDALTREAERSGRSKNQIILEAIEHKVARSGVPAYRTFPLDAWSVDRAALYEKRLE